MVYGLGGGRKLLERSFLPPYPHLSRTLKRGAFFCFERSAFDR